MMANEESIYEAMQVAMQGGRGAFCFLRWLYRHVAKQIAETPQREADRLMKDACSRYRGGYYSPENEALTKGLLSDLSAGMADSSNAFVFLGSRNDLSVFWQITEPVRRTLTRTIPEQRVVVPRKMIDEIPDEEIRQRTLAAFTKAQADGLLSYDGRSYSITEAGQRYITKSDFVLRRIEAEYKFFTGAETVLEAEADDIINNEKEAWLDAELRERGVDADSFPGCRRVTIDRSSLQVKSVGKDWLTNVPRTSRKQKVILPAADVVELNEKTLVAFINPNKQYEGRGTKSQIDGAELMASFDDKTAEQKRRPSVESIRKTATVASLAPQPRSPAKLHVGDVVHAPDHYSNSLKLNEYKVLGILVDIYGRNLYKLAGEEVPEQILPEEALERFMFTDLSQGEAYLSAHGTEAADYADELLAQTMGEKFASADPSEKITYALTLDKQNLIANYGDTCRVKLPGKQVEQVIVPTKDVLQQGEHLQITLHSEQSYKVITGAYGYNVSGQGLSKLAGATVQKVVKTPEAVVGTVMQTAGVTAPAMPKIGDSLIVPIGSPLGDAEIMATLDYRVVERLSAGNGETLYKLVGGYQDTMIVPEKAIGEYCFTDGQQMEAYLSEHGGRAHDKNDFQRLSFNYRDQTQLTVVEKEAPYSLLLDKDCLISSADDTYKVRLPDSQGAVISVPAKDIAQEGNQLHITLHTDKFYEVSTGVYDRTTLSGHGVAQLGGKTGAAVGAATQAANVVAPVANTTVAAHATVNATVAAIPVPEPITATAKTLYAAASTTVAQTAVQTVQTSLKLTQTIGKEG